MNELLLQTRSLLRKHPVLWLPTMFVSALSYAWSQLATFIVHGLAPSILTKHSALGGAVPDISPLRIAASSTLSFLGKNGCQYADICCFVAALLITAKMVGRTATKDTELVPRADLSIANRMPGVLRLSLMAYLLALAAGTLVMTPSLYYLNRAHLLRVTTPYLLVITAACMYIMLAYFLSPGAIRLLRVSHGAGLTAGEIALSRRCSLCAGAAMTLFSAAPVFMPTPIAHTLVQRALLTVFWNVLIALPYAPLFVALSLIAEGKDISTPAADSQSLQVI